jgi:diguanylate cyclase (GGDEF)-like protein
MTEEATNSLLSKRIRRSLISAFSDDLLSNRREFDGDRFDKQMTLSRKVAYRYVLMVLAVLLGPIDAYNFYSGNYVAASGGFVVLVAFLINIRLLILDKKPFLSPPTVLLMTLALVLTSLAYGQTYNLYWIYPMLVALPVLLKTRVSVWLGVLAGFIVMPFVFIRFDTSTSIIICLSMAHTWLISAWLMYAVSEQSRKLSELAHTDPLTGAFNRRQLQIEAGEALQLWKRHKRPTTLLLVDVDHFKQVNDDFGHERGDQALCGIVKVIHERLRVMDHTFRYGGEEFVVMLTETDNSKASHVAEEICAAIKSAQIISERAITVSIGVCDVTQVEDVDQWLNQCDLALYKAKETGRDRVVIAEPAATA